MSSSWFVNAIALGTSFALIAAPATAQVRTVDPNSAAQSDFAPPPASDSGYGTTMPAENGPPPGPSLQTDAAGAASSSTAATSGNKTYQQGDVLDAAEGVFGKGAEGLAKLLQKILREQGEPNGYIAGREAGGAVVVGLRYGSGTLHHKIEGDMPVYWTGPSLGFDLGANGAKTFVLVYNLYDSAELFHRFPAAEGNVYVVGGFTASYLRRGDVVLIPIRLGVGWRLGANVGYMKFTRTSKWMPL
ncbi:DUF1134 domain-containing protein [Flavisphingomonas formosensis]|uniref:DUF1134 domain-containing protein n=1 Tax=Flavisphingomonas formosensis TaxID=861534 RepID=UPI0012FBA217|nr:DUF1134 domain-containing protein [Sphingomonas formosensis]